MPMSEHELQVLEQLEQEFGPSPSAGVPQGWVNRAASKRLVAAGVGLPVGLLLMLTALIVNSAGGVLLALLAYGLILGSSVILVDIVSHSPAAGAQRLPFGQPARRPWFLQ